MLLTGVAVSPHKTQCKNSPSTINMKTSTAIFVLGMIVACAIISTDAACPGSKFFKAPATLLPRTAITTAPQSSMPRVANLGHIIPLTPAVSTPIGSVHKIKNHNHNNEGINDNPGFDHHRLRRHLR
ncbi:unnamed protein product [Arctia plantaginis]|uniref:Uncharacterized protein n=1 Tax=Arctia plantaginis TaxID=874455 RepID=A0A8S0ZTP4_ARCPL|nr:unnamed protein product [Arctia plantaginis]